MNTMEIASGTLVADLALAKIVDLLLDEGFGFTIPAWDGDAYLKINNALHAITDLTITSNGDVAWELSRPGARFRDCSRPVSPGRSPNPPCASRRNGLSTVAAIRRGSA